VILLLDSHALVWSLTDPARLSSRGRSALEDPDNLAFASAISAYELELKRDRDPELARMPTNLEDAARQQGFEWLSVSVSHASSAARLPRHHGDPFDRILIAQAFAEGAALVSLDRWFPTYGVSVFW
jgi:PIN domain nuclease of toxin-antitoxin system